MLKRLQTIGRQGGLQVCIPGCAQWLAFRLHGPPVPIVSADLTAETPKRTGASKTVY